MEKLQQPLEKDRICWNDKWAIIIALPILSLIIPFVFFGLRFTSPPYISFPAFFTTLIMTAAIWLGNRLIMIWSRNMYPFMEQLKKRLLFQSTLMLIYTLLTTLTIGFFLENFSALKTYGISEEERQISGINAALFTTIAITAIYEVIYFVEQLKESLTKSELLKRESLRAELNALKTQVNPHFLFNNLNTLCAIIPEDSDKAVQFVEQLSKVYRYILEVRDDKSIPLTEEIKILNAYAFLLSTRFGSNFNLHIQIPESMLRSEVIPFSLQLLVENALKHNIVSKECPLHIDILAENNELIVRNNLQKKQLIEKSTGIGLKNIRNRYSLLTDRLITVTETPQFFTVALPLI
ncbi:MAG: sensor histidine kinase [Sediminibacterium sp.]